MCARYFLVFLLIVFCSSLACRLRRGLRSQYPSIVQRHERSTVLRSYTWRSEGVRASCPKFHSLCPDLRSHDVGFRCSDVRNIEAPIGPRTPKLSLSLSSFVQTCRTACGGTCCATCWGTSDAPQKRSMRRARSLISVKKRSFQALVQDRFAGHHAFSFVAIVF